MDSRLKVLPTDFLNRAQKIFPPGRQTEIFTAYITPRPTTLRINTLKTSADKVMQFLQKQQIPFETERLLPNCLYLKKISTKKITETSLYQNGEIYLQNVSSQIPAVLLDPKPGENVLDLCASPGSKTTQMAALMQNEGKLIALEPDHIRFERLKHNIELMGCTNVEALCQRGESFCQRTGERFDKILVDAPCSGDGTFYVHERAGFSHWSVDFVKKISKLQKKLLQAALGVLKPGGILVYSTCSISPEENEAALKHILEKNLSVKTLPLTNTLFFHPAIKTWNGVSYSLVQNARRILPNLKTEGFFVALVEMTV